jgi:hypothetical protein
MNNYVEFKDKFYCKLHRISFNKNSKCPTCVSTGTIKQEKEIPILDKGFEQGVASLTRNFDKHSHAFRFVVQLKEGLDNWSKRNECLESKGFKAVRKGGIGRIFMSDCFGFKCWFADKSITIYFPSWKRYFVDEARFGYNFAVSDLNVLLNKLEQVFNVSFLIDDKYIFKCSGQHHGLIHNSLAKMYNRDKTKLNVYDKNGEFWLLIDNSNPEGFGLNEVETISKVNAVKDMDDVVSPFFNQLRETELMPRDILRMFKELIDDRKYYAENMRSHVQAIQDLSKGVNELREQIRINKRNNFIDKFR